MKMRGYFFALAVIFLLAACGKKSINVEGVPNLDEARKEMDANPNSVEMKLNFVGAVLFEQQQLKPKKKDIKLLESVHNIVNEHLPDYSETWEWFLADARLYFQQASYWNAKGDYLEAADQSQRGIEIFSDLYMEYPENLEVRAYRAINLMNLPSMFEQGESVDEDFEFLLESALSSERRSEMSAYEKGLMQFVFEGGLSYYKKGHPTHGKIEEALEILNS